MGWYHGSFPMAPYAGLVRDSTVDFEGRSYRLQPNYGAHAGHGVVFDRPWSVAEHSASRLVLGIALDERWPWGGEVAQVFDLEPGSLTMRLTVTNEQRRMPAALGYHPWFVRHPLGKGEASYSFKPLRRYAMDRDGFPQQPGPDLGSRPWDDVFTDLQADPAVSWEGGPTLRLSSDAPVWTLFERLDSGFCIEPLTAPPNSIGRARAAIVEPGVPLSLLFTIGWN